MRPNASFPVLMHERIWTAAEALSHIFQTSSRPIARLFQVSNEDAALNASATYDLFYKLCFYVQASFPSFLY